MSSEERSRIKVTDRRMFTPDGELREDVEADRADTVTRTETAAPATSPSSDPQSEGVHTPAERPAEPRMRPEPDFTDLISVLAEPIALFLGDVRLPSGEPVEDLDRARFHIDVLDLLRRKTDGNLTQDEAGTLQELLYQLRMRYVQKRG